MAPTSVMTRQRDNQAVGRPGLPPSAASMLPRCCSSGEPLAPPPEGVPVEVAHEGGVQLLVGQVLLDPLRPVPLQVVIADGAWRVPLVADRLPPGLGERYLLHTKVRHCQPTAP